MAAPVVLMRPAAGQTFSEVPPMIRRSASEISRMDSLSVFWLRALLVEHHIRLDGAAAAAPGDAFGVEDIVQIIEFSALFAVIAVDAAVELQDVLAASGLMEAVDVLGDDGCKLPLLLPLGQLAVGGVGLGVGGPGAWPGRSGKNSAGLLS